MDRSGEGLQALAAEKAAILGENAATLLKEKK